MRAAVRIRNRICEALDLVVVAVVILEDDIDEHFFALPRKHDRLRMDDLFVLAQLANEFLDPFLVDKSFFLRRIAPFIDEADLKAWIQKRQLAQPACQPLELEFGGDRENRRVGEERDQRAGLLFVFQLGDDFQFLGGLATLERHVMDLAFARNFDLEPIRKRVDTLRADTVQAAGIFVGALPELSAGVEVRQDQFDGWHFPFRMHVDRDTAPVVLHRNRAVDVNRDIDPGAEPGQMLVDRVVENFEHHVVQPALIRVADIHARALSNGLEPL